MVAVMQDNIGGLGFGGLAVQNLGWRQGAFLKISADQLRGSAVRRGEEDVAGGEW